MPLVGVRDVQDKLRGVTVLLRSSLNVPIVDGRVANPFRLARAAETIQFLNTCGAKTIVVSHIDGPAGVSLAPVHAYMRTLGLPLGFVPDISGESARTAARALQEGGTLLLENIRRDPGEEKNDEQFARKLASLADVYVNDDFAVSHRKHASIVGVPKFLPSYAGVQFMAEVEGLSKALNPKSPSLALLGGAKFVTKEPLIRALLAKYDQVFIGGALADDFLKAKGFEVGRSLVSDSPNLKDLLQNSKIILPEDVTVMGVNGRDVKAVSDILSSEVIYDIGPTTLAKLEPFIQKARTVLWNGPMGNFEQGFREMTEALARLVAGADGVSVVGGGDTVAAIQRLGLNTKFEFLSTAGGAMLEFLATGTLPGIRALLESRTL